MMKNIAKLSMTALISMLLLTSCQNVRSTNGDVSLVGRSTINGEVIEYKRNGEVIRNGKIGYYKIVDDNTVRVYTDANRPNYGDLYSYTNNNGRYNFAPAPNAR